MALQTKNPIQAVISSVGAAANGGTANSTKPVITGTGDAGNANNVKLSLIDVLNLGEADLFQKDGKQQMMVTGSDGDTMDLSNTHIAGVADGQWEQHGTTQVGDVTYNVYEHSSANVELLIEPVIRIDMR
ncbi:hypothetical protein [Caballeronia mineralivorans]|uniref:hypothetical protein n=1 Tax=Caballeronia mineralivorans TaxID=2010198 RepID=UPI00069F881A|nr:hypothetical protein [Caballeronia mineralivorans]